jgi:hypothetical protein
MMGLCVALVAIAAISLVVMLLWNALIPSLFDGPTLSYFQSVGILLLSHLLLRGTPLDGMRAWRRANRRRRWKQRLTSMSAAERAEFCNELGITRSQGVPDS